MKKSTLLIISIALLTSGCAGSGASSWAGFLFDDADDLVAKGNRAYISGRLLTPDRKSALYYYREALEASPRHEGAIMGMNNISNHYLRLAREALDRNELVTTGKMLAIAETTGSPSAESRIIRTTLDDMLAKSRGVTRDPQREYFLSVTDLENRNQEIQRRIRQIAHYVKDTNKAVVIVGRNPTEIGWIFKELRTNLPDYRIRANIETGFAPKVILLPYRQV